MPTWWFDIAAFDYPPVRNYETDFDDWRLATRRARQRPEIARDAAARAIESGVDALGLPAGVASGQFTHAEAVENIDAFAAAAHSVGLKLVVRTGAYDLAAPRRDGLPGSCEPALCAAKAVEAGADEVEVFAPSVSVAADASDDLRAKADRINEQLRDKHLLDGQIMTVLDTRYNITAPENEWQEDSDWITGLYCAAMSMAYATTGEARYRENAREAFLALHELNTVSGVRGVVARHSREARPTDLNQGRKRWQQAPQGGRWFSGDTSRDQLSGHYYGLATYFDLAATDDEREIVRQDIDDTTRQIIDHDLWAYDWDGKPCTYANFFVAPLQGLSVVQIAHHITGDSSYRDKLLELIDPHFFLGHAIREAGRQQDAFFQHYQQDSPIYHLLLYERDPALLRGLLRCLRLLNSSSSRNGNAYHLIEMAAFQPESGAGDKAMRELSAFNDAYLDIPRWRIDMERILAPERADQLDSHLRRALEAALTRDREGLDPDHLYIPMELRPSMEFGWQYHADDLPHAHGPFVRYPGVDYLLAFWLGRYHGVL